MSNAITKLPTNLATDKHGAEHFEHPSVYVYCVDDLNIRLTAFDLDLKVASTILKEQ